MPTTEITIDGETREVEVDGCDWRSAEPDVGIMAGYYEGYVVWHWSENRQMTMDEHDKISGDEDERLRELVNEDTNGPEEPDPDFLRDRKIDDELMGLD